MKRLFLVALFGFVFVCNASIAFAEDDSNTDDQYGPPSCNEICAEATEDTEDREAYTECMKSCLESQPEEPAEPASKVWFK